MEDRCQRTAKRELSDQNDAPCGAELLSAAREKRGKVTKTLELDLELSRRVEFAEAEVAVEGAHTLMSMKPDAGTAVEHIAGGYAVYCGANSPVTQAVGLGLNGPVAPEEFDRLEEFFFSRSEPVRVETSPLADASLFALYRERGYGVTEFSNVMVRPMIFDEQWPDSHDIEIRKANRDEMDLWTLTVAQGFAENYPVTEELIEVMRVFGLSPGMECYLARIEGKVAGGATLSLRGKVAGLFGASTLADFRRRGVQTALLRTRLRRAAEAGCEIGVSLAQPGSHSQRNITKVGFRTLYTRVKFEREAKK
jgi:GNAT superfamily N-acetyltransferase